MSEIKLTTEESKRVLDTVVEDITKPLKQHKGFVAWIAFLGLLLVAGAYAYVTQLTEGLQVTGMRDYASWGMYIANFVFFVAVSLVGMLISSVLGLLKVKWITPISRIAEFIALAFAMWAGLVIVIDMGRPDRLHHVFLYGRFQSPILWDVTVVTTYTAISSLLVLLPLIPDAAILQKRMVDAPKWQQKLYKAISFNWKGTSAQFKLLHKAIRILLILVIPVAFAIHTVTSWLFASTLRVGWDSTIFGPYFVTGAFVCGVGAVTIAMFFFRNNYKLKDYITEEHFDKIGKLLVLVSLVYLYFNINEYLVPGYKMKAADKHHFDALFFGKYAWMFWFAQICGLIIPIILMLFKPMRKPLPAMIISIFVVLGAWFKRYIIVVPTMEHPYLPIQNMPDHYMHYTPTGIEIMLTIFPIAGAILIVTILAKIFPVVTIWEVAEEKGVAQEDLLK